MTAQPDPKCTACQRTTATHAPGCSVVDCPHRQPWCGSDGAQGFPGQLAEERILRRRSEKNRAVAVNVADL